MLDEEDDDDDDIEDVPTIPMVEDAEAKKEEASPQLKSLCRISQPQLSSSAPERGSGMSAFKDVKQRYRKKLRSPATVNNKNGGESGRDANEAKVGDDSDTSQEKRGSNKSERWIAKRDERNGDAEKNAEENRTPKNSSSKKSKKSRHKSSSKKKSKKTKEKKVPQFMDISKVPYVREDLWRFVRAPLKEQPGTVCRCFIERERAAGKFSRYPTYKFFLEDSSRRRSARLLMFAQKKMSMTSHHVFSCEYEDLDKFYEERSKSYLGKLRADSATNEYILYDHGLNPRRLPWQEAAASPHLLREELAVIVFNRSKRCDPTRQMEVSIPGINAVYKRFKKWRPYEAADSMAPAFKRVRFRGAQNVDKGNALLCLNNHASRFDALSACLAEYNRRATMASCKNFQLYVSEPEDSFLVEQYESGVGKFGWGGEPQSKTKRCKPILQLGKIGDNLYAVDIQAPP